MILTVVVKQLGAPSRVVDTQHCYQEYSLSIVLMVSIVVDMQVSIIVQHRNLPRVSGDEGSWVSQHSIYCNVHQITTR